MFGCASVDSMKVMTRGTLKKIEKAGGKLEGEAGPEKATPASGKKRKGKATAAEGGDDAEESPAKKKGKGGGRKKKDVVAEGEGESESFQGIKALCAVLTSFIGVDTFTEDTDVAVKDEEANGVE